MHPRNGAARKKNGIVQQIQQPFVIGQNGIKLPCQRTVFKHTVIPRLFRAGGRAVTMAETLKHYRYSIAIENQISDYFYTERLISAFISMTVPIYVGARKIEKFFNDDGIIRVDEKQATNIKDVLRQCSERDYMNRLPAMRENYEKAKAYLNQNDMLYETLFIKPEQRKLNFDFSNIGGVK